MKRIITILIALNLLALLCNGQNWFQVGAKWHYTERFAFSGDEDFMVVEVEKDTLLQGIQCKKLTKQKWPYCTGQTPVEFMYESADSVFIFMPEFNSFKLFYNLNMGPGDTLVFEVMDQNIPPELDSIVFYVDSVDTISINGINLKRQHVSIDFVDESWNGPTIPDVIIERIGRPGYLFYYFREFLGSCDVNYSNGLRCYHDSTIGLYDTGIADSCTYTFTWVGIDQFEPIHSGISIFPNPATSSLTIEPENPTLKIEYTLQDDQGRIVKKGSEKRINTGALPRGIYILTVKTSDSRFYREKLVLI